MAGNGRRTRYVVLPREGTSGPSMEASAFRDGTGSSLAGQLKTMKRTALRATSTLHEDHQHSGWAEGPDTLALKDPDYEVISQRFSDGPALVRMTKLGRLALEAAEPGLRIVPLTGYRLPGEPAHETGARAAGINARGQDGSVFSNDARASIMSRLSGGDEGAGVVVGVIDTGIDRTHPALQASVPMVRCYVPGEDPGDGRPANWGAAQTERAGHGTHVAGIIAAQTGHGGPPGVAQRAKIFGYRVYPDNPKGPSVARNIAVIDAIRAAISDGCHIINLSLEGSSLREDGVRNAVEDAWNRGVICVGAAGNGFGNPVNYPAALPFAVAVTATGQDGSFPESGTFGDHVSDNRSSSDTSVFLARFSNYGPQVKFTAPGHAIVSTFPDDGWWVSSGTSMAAPFISGMLARLLSDEKTVLGMPADAERSGAMLQLLVSRARRLGFPEPYHEGYGLPT